MRVITTFQCEKCGCIYSNKEVALFCEKTELPPCPVSIGDKVEVYERYTTPVLDVVMGVYIKPTLLATALLSRSWTDEEFATFLSRSNSVELNPHEWIIRLKHRHHYGKDYDAYTYEYGLNMVRLPGANNWLDGSPVIPE